MPEAADRAVLCTPEVVHIREGSQAGGTRLVLDSGWTSQVVGSLGAPFSSDRCTNHQFRMLTALETTTATVTSEARDCSIMSSFAQSVSGMVSVGLNAVALVKEV